MNINTVEEYLVCISYLIGIHCYSCIHHYLHY
jgi:hypothetical protein